jgi:hypothetical protein
MIPNEAHRLPNAESGLFAVCFFAVSRDACDVRPIDASVFALSWLVARGQHELAPRKISQSGKEGVSRDTQFVVDPLGQKKGTALSITNWGYFQLVQTLSQ